VKASPDSPPTDTQPDHPEQTPWDVQLPATGKVVEDRGAGRLFAFGRRRLGYRLTPSDLRLYRWS